MTNIYPYGKTAAERAQDLSDYVKALKRELADKIIDALAEDTYLSAEHIARTANQIAEKEGALEVAHLLKHAEANEVSKDTLARMLLREAVRPADDTWSGRGNDVRRAFADGRRNAIDDAVMEFIG